ncbi:winged helix-turn-helix transcriptional regulator [Umezawaea sp. Da 62-37]|uniref:winged helix-turn-helix transcriptional regulator n=1 Tax=Umezawaea sp. Da 62-37 TaxID=3075927 RepID=UPI0028F6DD8F|nr:winged helix-turn-helix transcriptional regulator [Umezawaea sp. Da 62-37]WNV92159.1 winged helix-turn-helix transcriptional regulator [Umezawaea sp. Da 62-37]
MLARTLRALTRDGFISRTATPTVPIRVTYALTALGTDLTPPSGVVTCADHHSGTIQAACNADPPGPARRDRPALSSWRATPFRVKNLRRPRPDRAFQWCDRPPRGYGCRGRSTWRREAMCRSEMRAWVSSRNRFEWNAWPTTAGSSCT